MDQEGTGRDGTGAASGMFVFALTQAGFARRSAGALALTRHGSAIASLTRATE